MPSKGTNTNVTWNTRLGTMFNEYFSVGYHLLLQHPLQQVKTKALAGILRSRHLFNICHTNLNLSSDLKFFSLLFRTQLVSLAPKLLLWLWQVLWRVFNAKWQCLLFQTIPKEEAVLLFMSKNDSEAWQTPCYTQQLQLPPYIATFYVTSMSCLSPKSKLVFKYKIHCNLKCSRNVHSHWKTK